MLLRILATLAFAASFDILIMGGKYLSGVDKVAVAIFQSFRSSVRPDHATFERRPIVEIDYVVIDQADAAGEFPGRNRRARYVYAIILVEVEHARAERVAGLLGLFLAHDVEEAGERGAFRADTDVVTKCRYIRSHHVKERLVFVDDERSDRLVRAVVDELAHAHVVRFILGRFGRGN